MNLDHIVDEIASRADDFLEGASNRREANAGIMELINADYPQLTPDERKLVAEKVIKILEAEDFFESSRFTESDEGESEGEADGG